MDLHDKIIDELIGKKSISALIWRINNGREVELIYSDKKLFISRDKAKKYVSLWQDTGEQSFDSVEQLIESAVLDNKVFLFAWEDMNIETVF